MRVHDDDALDHARENRLHPPAIPRLFGEPPAHLLHGLVERAGDLAQLVVAEIHPGGREIPRAVAPGEGGDQPRTRCPMRAETIQAMSGGTKESQAKPRQRDDEGGLQRAG